MKYITIPIVAKVEHLLWHGTTSKHLHSILKNGLSPLHTDKNSVWDMKIDGGQTFFNNAVYFTPKICSAFQYANKAVKKYGGKPLLVLANISMGHDTIPDDNSLKSLDQSYVKIPKFTKKELLEKSMSFDDYYELVKPVFIKGIRIALYNDFHLTEDNLSRILKSKAIDDYMIFILKAIVNGTLDKINLRSQEYYDLEKQILYWLRRYSSLVTKDGVAFSVHTNVGFKGNRKILSIFECENILPTYETMSRSLVKDIKFTFVQKYGDSRYKNILINAWNEDYYLSYSHIQVD